MGDEHWRKHSLDTSLTVQHGMETGATPVMEITVKPETGYLTPSARSHPASVGVRHRSALKLFTLANNKTPRGEAAGYLSAILYLQPHTSGGGTNLCPYSTPDCQKMCLAGAGLSGLPKQLAAKQRRTDWLLAAAPDFVDALSLDIRRLVTIALKEGLSPVVRLNGTSDVLWERLTSRRFCDRNLMQGWPDVQFMDYTKIPLEKRQNLPPNYHLTYSVEGPKDMARAVEYLRAGHSVAAVVPEDLKQSINFDSDTLRLGSGTGEFDAPLVDGDLTDLRHLDPPGSLILLKPKGRVVSGLMRPHIFQELDLASRSAA